MCGLVKLKIFRSIIVFRIEKKIPESKFSFIKFDKDFKPNQKIKRRKVRYNIFHFNAGRKFQ